MEGKKGILRETSLRDYDPGECEGATLGSGESWNLPLKDVSVSFGVRSSYLWYAINQRRILIGITGIAQYTDKQFGSTFTEKEVMKCLEKIRSGWFAQRKHLRPSVLLVKHRPSHGPGGGLHINGLNRERILHFQLFENGLEVSYEFVAARPTL
jgi:hypothetical protein